MEDKAKVGQSEHIDGRIKELEAELKSVKDKFFTQKKRAEKAEALLKDLEKRPVTKVVSDPVGTNDCVILGGISWPIVGNFRADNTFVEVKRGHCHEGLTLIAINKQH